MTGTTRKEAASSPLVIRFFAILRELTGRQSVEISLEEPLTVAAVLDRLAEDYPEIQPYRSTMRAAVNWEYVDETNTVFNGDEVAVITPVSGG